MPRAATPTAIYGCWAAWTTSGKIMRRLLREIVTTNSVSGDVTTLEDLSVVSKLAAQQEDD